MRMRFLSLALMLGTCSWLCSPQTRTPQFPFGEAAYYALSGVWVLPRDLARGMKEEQFSWGLGKYVPYASLIVDLGDGHAAFDRPGISRRVDAIQQISPDRYRLTVWGSGSRQPEIIEVVLKLDGEWAQFLGIGDPGDPNFYRRLSGPTRGETAPPAGK